jgi:hypothetical protein
MQARAITMFRNTSIENVPRDAFIIFLNTLVWQQNLLEKSDLLPKRGTFAYFCSKMWEKASNYAIIYVPFSISFCIIKIEIRQQTQTSW